MNRVPFIIFCLTIISCVISHESSTKRGYIFTAPKRLVPGEKANVCYSFYNLEPPVHVTVDLLIPSTSANSNTNQEDDIIASVQTTLNEISEIRSCAGLQVPSNANYSEANLRLRLKFDKHLDYVVDAQKKVSIEHDVLVTFIETDKAIYKPGQNVNIRILNLKPNLKPWTEPIPKVWIENPKEVRVAQWTNVKTENGMAQLSFPLSDESNSGVWKIVVEKTRPELTQTTKFEVKEYVLPRFQVTIESPKYILANTNNATWKICSKYSYGQPVKGTLSLNIKPQILPWIHDNPSSVHTRILPRRHNEPDVGIKYNEQINNTLDGCTSYTANTEALGLFDVSRRPHGIAVVANFTEAKTGVVETASSQTKILRQPFTIELNKYSPKYFKPTLPYYGKLQVLNADASAPAADQKIQICLSIRYNNEWNRIQVDCRNFTSSNPDGFVDFTVAPQHTNVDMINLKTTVIDYPKNDKFQLQMSSVSIDVYSWYSNSSSYLQVTRGSPKPVVCGQSYTYNVTYTSPSFKGPIKFYRLISSQGKIIESDEQIHDSSPEDSRLDNSVFQGSNVLGANNKTFIDSLNVHRLLLEMSITPKMAPITEVVLYYIRPDGELVSASHTIEVGLCLENPVELNWQKNSQKPGSMATLQLEAAPNSLCGISAIDKSSRFLKSSANSESYLLEPDMVLNRMKMLQQSNEFISRSGDSNACIQNPARNYEGDDDFHYRLPHHSDDNALKDFDRIGTIIMSDFIVCPASRTHRRRPFPVFRKHNVVNRNGMAMPTSFGNVPHTAVVPYSFSTPQQQIPRYKENQQPTPTVIRSYFPETWIWELIPIGNQGKTTIERKLPDTITDWVSNVVCISDDKGLGIGASSEIVAFQPFFLDYILPYSVKRGEQLHLKVSLFNYMPHNLPVVIKLLNHEGLTLSSNHSSEAVFCVQSKDSVVHEFLLLPKQLGELNITVAAEIDTNQEKVQNCNSQNVSYIKDQIVKPVLVKAEGFPVEISKSAFLCPKDFSNDSSLVWKLELPKPDNSNEQVVNGSIKAYISIIGDILGPALDNLENLIQLPMGCGEQNMILFVPNIHAIAYLDAVKRPTALQMRTNALNNMRKGYQRELNYRHSDGSYSAFGSSDKEGSMWLTAFVIKSFSQARKMIEIDERDLKMSVDWITNQQLENGCFPVVGQVFHKDMKGGLSVDGSSTTLTAYVLIALLESKVPLTTSLVNKAVQCMEKTNTSSNNDTKIDLYGAILKTYALTLLKHSKANESLQALMDQASQQEDFLWWEDKSRPNSLSLSIEMTAYGVLSLLTVGGEANKVEVFKAVRWLSSKRNSKGGFSSTQDTILGLEALTKYALSVIGVNPTDLKVRVTAKDLKQDYKIDEVNRVVLQRAKLPTLPTEVKVSAAGEGCLLVQANLRYNKINASKSEAFEVSTDVKSLFGEISNSVYSHPDDQCAIQRLTICARYKLDDGESNMALLEIDMVTGFVPDRSSLRDLVNNRTSGVKRFEENRDKVVIYFDKLTSQNSCISFKAIRENVVDNIKPGNIKLYDYYRQEHSISTSYEFAEVCRKENEASNV